MNKELINKIIGSMEELISEAEYALDCTLQADGDDEGDSCPADLTRAVIKNAEEIVEELNCILKQENQS